MKPLIFLLSIITLLFVSCEEVPPYIDFSSPVIPLKDSTFIVNPPPPAQHKAVLIEDITGVRCINCPDAAAKAKDIVNQKGADSVIVVAQYPITILDNFTHPYSGVPQLANETSKQVVEALGVPQGLPSGYVDRKLYQGKTVRDIGYPEWINYVNLQLREKTPVNIALSRILNGRNVKVEINLQYNTTVTTGNAHKFAIYLIEDGIVSTQYDHSGQNLTYVHNHALRYAFGLAMGNPLAGPNVAGKTYIKQFGYEIPAEYVIANCHLVCVVLDGTTQEVLNVREIDLK